MSEHRLIYADELYDMLADKLTWLMDYGSVNVYLKVGKDIREAINEQPTAYDIDKVVEQLESEASRCASFFNGDYRDDYERGKFEAYNEAVEIVKKGSTE